MSALICMAVAIYFEARGEPIDGQYAVADVIVNRVNHERYPDDVCSVVYQGNQFSFTLKYNHDNLPAVETTAFVNSLVVASDVLQGKTLGVSSTHYHTLDVSPSWSTAFLVDGVVGRHVFYTCEGYC